MVQAQSRDREYMEQLLRTAEAAQQRQLLQVQSEVQVYSAGQEKDYMQHTHDEMKQYAAFLMHQSDSREHERCAIRWR